jgi:murein tripeptide amidase MpaA
MLPLALGVAATALGAVQPQDLLPPLPPWHGSSERLVAAPEDPWITPSERTQLLDTPNYEDTIAYLRRLCAASPLFSLAEFGRTAQGRPLYVLIASKDAARTPAAVRATGRPVVLAQAGIHSGEIDGKDAGLMLLRDIAFHGQAELLDGAVLLFIPVLNADGHERSSEWTRPNQRGPVHMGWRTTAQNLNLNRDYMKADAPEMRGLLALLNDWDPTLYLDLHVTDGIDYQYDITFGYNGDLGSTAWSPHIAGWLNTRFRPAVEAALRAAGHIPGPLISAIDPRNLYAGISAGTAAPRFSPGYGDLRHLPTVLVENHSLKSYRQRVLGTYVLLEAALRAVARDGEALRVAIGQDRAARPATLQTNWGGEGERRLTDFAGISFETYTSAASGHAEVRWTGQPKTYRDVPFIGNKAGLTLARPKAYWVPVSKPEVIDRLKLHGVQCETLTAEKTVAVELARLVNPVPRPGEGFHPFEGRYTLTTDATPEPRTETYPAGSVRVPTDQPLGELAMALLEARNSDSLLAWGFFPEILQRTEYIEGYVLAPLADQLLAANPELKREFEAQLARDPKFAADPNARLAWFYQRTKFYDERYLLYPVGIER